MKEEFDRVTNLAAKSVKWTSLIEVLSRVATPLTFLLLAAVLPPADFGILASASIIVSFTQLFIDNGFGKSIVQYSGDSLPQLANATFFLNALLGVFLYLAIFASAPLVAGLFGEDQLVPVVRVLGVQVLLASLSAVHQALLQRSFAFKRLLAVKLTSVAASGAVSVILAWRGYGVWSLVAGALAATLVSTCVLWVASPWRPKMNIDWAIIAPTAVFTAWTLVEAISTWAVMWADSVAVGYFLGVDQLGVYRIATNIVVVVFALTLNPLISLMYPLFSRLQGDMGRVRATFESLGRLVAAISLPVGLLIAVAAPILASMFMSTSWAGLAAVVALLGVREGIGWIASMNPELYRGVGRPDINVKIVALALLLIIPAFVFVAPHGLQALAAAKIVVTLGALAIHWFYTGKLLQLRWRYMWDLTRTAIIGCVALVAAAAGTQYLLSAGGLGPVAVAVVAVVVAGFTYLLVAWKSDPELVAMVRRLLGRVAA